MKFVSRLSSFVKKDGKASSSGEDSQPNGGDSPFADGQTDGTRPPGEIASSSSFKYTKNVCALSWWEPIRLLEEGSISDIHLARRRDRFVSVRYKDKRDVMDLAKKHHDGKSKESDDANAEVYVLKSIMKDHIGDDLVLEEMRSEIRTMSKLDHPNICRLVEAYERRRHIYLIMDFCSGGNLAGRVPMPERNAAVVSRKIMSAVAYMHGLGVAHRDIKLENIMLDSEGEIKLIDFGLATAYLSGDYKNMTDRVGTLYSIAPQVLNGSYDERCDLWSVGVVAYLLLSGKQPFWGPNTNMPWHKRRKVIMDLIKNCKYAPMTTGPWQKVSEPAKDFVRSLLQLNPDARPTAREALDSKWLKSMGGDEGAQDGTDDCQILGADATHDEQLALLSNLRVKVWRLLSKKLTEDEIQDLRAYLEVHDEDGGGLISVGALRDVLEEVSESSEDLTKEDIITLFSDEAIDASVKLNYVDLMVEVLVGRGRNTVDAFANALDNLDAEGTRKVAADDLRTIIDSLLASDMREDVWDCLEIDEEGQVNTTAVLRQINKMMARHNRDSVRGGQSRRRSSLFDG